MADNIQLNAGTGGAVLAADDVGGTLHQRMKVEFGADGSASDVATSNPLPAQLRNSGGTEIATASNPVRTDPTGTTTQPISDAGGSVTTDTPQLASTLGQKNMAGSAAVVIASDQAEIPVKAGANLNTSALAMEAGGNLASIKSNTDKIPAQGQAAMAASAPVVIASNQTDLPVTQKAATPPAAVTMQNVATANGNGTSLPVTGHAVAVLNVVSSPAMSGGTTVNFEASVDDTTWVAVQAQAVGAGTAATSTTADGDFRINCAGYKSVRARISGYSAGTVTVKGYASPVGMAAGVVVPVAAASLPLPSGAATESTLSAMSGKLPATLGQKAMTASLAVVVASDQTAVPISDNGGSVTTDTPQLPSSLGQKTMANSVGVVIASDQTAIPLAAGTAEIGNVKNSGTFAVQDSEKIVDNAAFTDGTSKVMMAGFAFDETAGTALTENDAAAARVDSKRAQVLVLEDATTRGQRQSVNSGGAAEVHGDAAHGASVAGNPVLLGLEARTSDGAAVTNGQAVRAQADLNGKQVVLPYAIPENEIDGATAAITGTSDTSVIAAQGSGVRIYVTQILVTNSHATVGTVVEIKDGSTVKYRGYAAPAGGGFAVQFPVPLRLTANTALNAANVTTGSNTYVSASGFKAP